MIIPLVKRILGRRERRRTFVPRADDVFLVAYPKSGSTWPRFMLGNYVTEGKCDFTNAHLLMPDVHFNPEQIEQLHGPRVIKSHFAFRPKYGRVMYLAGVGRDVAASYHFHHRKHRLLDPQTGFAEFLSRFHDGNLDDYGSWSEYVNFWLVRGPNDFLLTRYEKLTADPVSRLEEVIAFVGLPHASDRIHRAVEQSTFQRMRRLEEVQHAKFEALSTSRTYIRHVRSGKAGQWQDYFDEATHAAFVAIHGGALERLGYPTLVRASGSGTCV